MEAFKKIVLALAGILFSVMLLLFGCTPQSAPGAETAQPELSAPILRPARTAEPTPEPTPGPDYSGLLRLSEVMAKNKATLLVGEEFPDWVEIENLSEEAVDLSGWTLSDQEFGGRRPFSDRTLPAGALLLVPCTGKLDFSLSQGETLSLFDPSGAVQDSVLCFSDDSDRSLIRGEDGDFTLCSYPTPGYANNAAGFESFSTTRAAASPLSIDEVVVSNQATPIYNGECFDWAVIRNSSDEKLSLLGYTLTDSFSEPDKWAFPDQSLAPGEELFLRCDGDIEPDRSNTGFSLDGAGEQLYLFDGEGALVDYIALHDIPLEGSMGRLEGLPGFYYFPTPTPFARNGEGFRRVTDRPVSLTPDGVYNDCEGLSVALSGSGEIRYTTDGSLPTLSSALYEEPIAVTETTVIRAVCREEGCAVSRPATFSFIVNENHSLPVLSLCTDDPAYFSTIYSKGNKVRKLGANLALYEDGETLFNRECRLGMKGWTSRDLPKKSMGVKFTGRYGGLLEGVDIFGNGITEYESLSIRAGQDYTFTMFRNEMFQDLCKEASTALYTQESKFCILYVNGRYWGIYCLKEDISRQYYASNAGVPVSTVDYMKAPFALGTDIMDVINTTPHRNMNDPDNYKMVTELFNEDSLVDWLLFESYTANTDTQGNLKVFRAPGSGGKWDLVFYDLDWGFYYPGSSFTVLVYGSGNSGNQMPKLYANIYTNPQFREKVLSRYAELAGGVLSNEHVLEKIDEYVALLEPEMPRDRERWDLTMERWYSEIDKMQHYINDNNWINYTIKQLCTCFNVSAAERAQYFPDLG